MFNRRTLIAAADRIGAVALSVVVAAAPPALAQDKSIVVASTTSTRDSGLFEYLLPLFTKKTGITVKVVAQGTGQALDTGRRGDADVVFVHAKAQEEKFLAEGQGVKRYPVMYNDFVLIGPKSDPAGIKGMKDVGKALRHHQGQEGRLHFARRPLRHPQRRAAAVEGGRHRHRKEGQGPLVQGDRPGHGRRAQHRQRRQGLCAVRPRHLDPFQEQGRPRDPGRRRQAHVQPIRRDAGEPGQAPEREEGARPAIHRLAGLAGRPEGHRKLQDQRPAVVLPGRQRSQRVMTPLVPGAAQHAVMHRRPRTPVSSVTCPNRDPDSIATLRIAMHPGHAGLIPNP